MINEPVPIPSGADPIALPDYTDADAAQAQARARRRRAMILGVVLALVVVAIAWFAFGRSKEAPQNAAPSSQLPSVTVVEPGRKQIEREITATGSLAAKRDMPVGVSGEGGEVRRVLVEPGQWVKAGQVLAVVDRSVQVQTAASLAAQVNVARSDLTIAQAELDRAQQLVDRGFISKADLQRKAATRDSAAARVRVAQAQLSEANARTGRLDIRAPTAGLILTRQVEPGQIVSSGSGTLFRMAMNGEIEMRAALSEGDLAGIRVGASAMVTPVGSSQSYAGRVWQVAPVVDPTSRQGIVRIALPYNPALRPGGFGQATIESGTADAPQLPQSAIQTDGKGNYVYIVDAANKAQRRDVKLGAVSDSGVIVTDGLNGTEKVVVSAGAFLNPGQTVKPLLSTASGR